MIENREFAKRQLRRMSGLDGFPQEPEAAEELLKAMMTFPIERDAEEFVTDWIARNPVCPKPSNLRRTTGPEQREWVPSWAEKKPQCPTCSGTGWRIVERNGMSGAQRCACTEVAGW